MSCFSFKNVALVILAASLVLLSTSAFCNAVTAGKYWKHGTNPHHVHVDKSKPMKGLKFNVLDYGAKGDGKSDDTKAFQVAWVNACKAEASIMIVPSGYKFLVRPTSFSGSNCHKNIGLQLDGTILAPTNSEAWATGVDQWLEFTNLVGFVVKGKGTLDGRGSVWWAKSINSFKQVRWQDGRVRWVGKNRFGLKMASFKLGKRPSWVHVQTLVSNPMDAKKQRTRPTALTFVGGSKLTVTGITIKNSPQFHLTFDNCDGVLVHGISISSPGDSPNTDGIHLTTSKNVIIHHADLACGDDCVSIQTGCTNVLIHDVNCGPGHGISIGSLGIDGTTACVSNITVRNVKLHDTMTGVRIKTWQGAKGLVRGVSFSNIQVSKVEVPIMIDQYYCDHSTCKNSSSAVSIANIMYENIRGTYTIQPLHLSCSDSKPCMNLNLSNIELKPNPDGHQMSGPFCWQAFGRLSAPIIPEVDCLQQQQSSSKWGPHDAKCAA